MEITLSLLAGLGFGSILTTIVQFFFYNKKERKARLYNEKKEAYLGLLEVLHRAAVEPSDKHAKAYALWQMRCELVGSIEVIKAVAGVAESEPGSEKRSKYFELLKSSMRKDLLKTM